MNCEKNAVVCEGYPEKQLWKSGKERAEEGTIVFCSLSRVVWQGVLTLQFRTYEVSQSSAHHNAALIPRIRDR
jgi:hypothetical protein